MAEKEKKEPITQMRLLEPAGYNCPVAKSVVKDSFSEEMVDNMHYCGGYREYWRNVKGCEGGVGDIEIHFVDSVVPGYFWIFPVNDEVANVGIGMVIGLLKKEKKKLEGSTKGCYRKSSVIQRTIC